MSELAIYQIDAFTDQIFAGNPAAICPLDDWLSDDLMQKIAAENNLSETAYFVEKADGVYDLRWFTPAAEIDLCGHATLATASLIFDRLNPSLNEISFDTQSGVLTVQRKDDLIEMSFPSRPATEVDLPMGFEAAHGEAPALFLRATKNMAVFDSEKQVADFQPNLSYIKAMQGDGLVVTAPGETCDFVSRYFAPHQGIDEDPVTGSAHCTSVPYWAGRLDKKKLHARQISKRSGDLYCEMAGDIVRMAGRAAFYMEGKIYLP